MLTDADKRAGDLYFVLMTELKYRGHSVISTLKKDPPILPLPLLREYCYLQLRMMCELLALGCLVAHGDITNTRYFQQEAYKADDIIRRLGELHQDFFPVPCRTITTFDPFGPTHVEIADPLPHLVFLKKEEVRQLYGKCGDILHKGDLQRVKSHEEKTPTDFLEINKWAFKIINLLRTHNITRIGGDYHFLTILDCAESEGRVRVRILRTDQ